MPAFVKKENGKSPMQLINPFIPELGTPYRGKVRDIYEKDKTLTMIASDRISFFDRVLNEPIRDKGRILTLLSLFWFERTGDIVPNHLMSHPDENVLIVKKCQPLPIEMVVREYLVGSLWRDYEKGRRNKCGVPLPEGLKRNDSLPHPIVTPSTKNHEGHDEDISKEELIERGIITLDQWNQLESYSLQLFQRGKEILKQNGIRLLDTKYEFGLDETGSIILIDEIHTPDSSRFWFEEDLEKKEVRFPDKEFAREWAMKQGFMGHGPLPAIPQEIQDQIRSGYVELYEKITGKKLPDTDQNVPHRLIENLKRNQIITGKFCLVLADSKKDPEEISVLKNKLQECSIPYQTLTIESPIDSYNDSLEPLVCLIQSENPQVNSRWPVIPFSGQNLSEAITQTLKKLENSS